MWSTHGLVFCHAILSLITIVEGTGGGGGENTGGVSDCVGKSNYNHDIKPFHYTNYSQNETSRKQYGGSLFLGEGAFSVRLEKRDLLAIEGSRSNACPADTLNLRLLGVAWIAPQTPSPAGSTNPFVLSLKAWRSDMPVGEIQVSYNNTTAMSTWCIS
jgi:hypothetical protein